MVENKKRKTTAASGAESPVPSNKAKLSKSTAAKQLKATEREFEKAFPVTKGTLGRLAQEALNNLDEGLTVELDPNNL